MGRYATVDQPVPDRRRHRPRSRPPPRFEPPAADRGHAPRRRPLGQAVRLPRARSPCSAAPAPASARPSPPSTPTATASSTSSSPPPSSGPKGVRDVLLAEQGRRPVRGRLGRARACPTTAPASASPRPTSTPTARSTSSSPASATTASSATRGKAVRGRHQRRPGSDGPPALGLTARWLDLDQDGDLDLYVVNYTRRRARRTAPSRDDAPPPGSRTRSTATTASPRRSPGGRRDNWAPLAVAPHGPPGDGRAVARLHALARRRRPARRRRALTPAIAALDIDDDRDLDLVLAADGAAARAPSSTTGSGTFHAVALEGPRSRPSRSSGLLVTDLDKDGRADLVGVGAGGRVPAWRNTTDTATSRGAKLAWESWPIDARSWRSAIAADLDLDTWPDLRRPAGRRATAPRSAWARNDGTAARRPARSPLGPDGRRPSRSSGFAARRPGRRRLCPTSCSSADGAAASARAEPRQRPALAGARPRRPLEVQPRPHADQLRTASGPGSSLEGQGLHVTYDHTTPDAGPRPVGRPGRARAGQAHVGRRWSASAGPTASCSAS